MATSNSTPAVDKSALQVPISPPSPTVNDAAAERLANLATPPGALGSLGDFAVWIAATQGQVPPR
jgi:nicotinate-nucleotide--dimethylbenzimidazole phosphoribosyltransferase